MLPPNYLHRMNCFARSRYRLTTLQNTVFFPLQHDTAGKRSGFPLTCLPCKEILSWNQDASIGQKNRLFFRENWATKLASNYSIFERCGYNGRLY